MLTKDTRRSTILVVEDDLDTGMGVEQALQQAGHEVHVALSAADALQQIEAGLDPDLIFADVFMPGKMTGVAFVREAVRHRPQAKVLMTSGFNAPFHFTKQPAEIEHEFLPKPYELKDLLLRVTAMLDAPGT